MRAMSAWTWASSLTSAITNSALPPASRIFAAVASPPSRLTSAQVTIAPSRAKERAVTRPIPLPLPVMSAIFPSSRFAIGLSASAMLGSAAPGPGRESCRIAVRFSTRMRICKEARRRLESWTQSSLGQARVLQELTVIDFSLPPDLAELKARVDRFIREAIVPLERDPRQGPHGPSEDFRRELVALGR